MLKRLQIGWKKLQMKCFINGLINTISFLFSDDQLVDVVLDL